MKKLLVLFFCVLGCALMAGPHGCPGWGPHHPHHPGWGPGWFRPPFYPGWRGPYYQFNPCPPPVCYRYPVYRPTVVVQPAPVVVQQPVVVTQPVIQTVPIVQTVPVVQPVYTVPVTTIVY